jgi:tripartite-type tricarboxylate transporter receptor subunit TctC
LLWDVIVKRFGTSVSVALLLGQMFGAAASPAFAQTSYPTRPVRLLVGFAGGTAPDIGARVLADKLAASLGKPVVVENVIGASGNIARDRVANSEPDGHTLAFAANSAIVINPPIYPLAPITQVCSYANILVVSNNVPTTNVQELVALAREKPGKLTIGHLGVGTTVHLSTELFKSMAGIDIQPVPYRNSVNLLADVVAGQIAMTFGTPFTALPLAREGRLRALATTSLHRIAVAPDVPTMDESGFPGFDVVVWYGLLAPAQTPLPIIDKLYRAIAHILAFPEVRRRYGELGCEVIGNTPQEFKSAIEIETPRWARFIDQLGIRLD